MKNSTPDRKDTICFLSLNGYKLFNAGSTAKIGGTELQLHIIAKALQEKSDFKIAYVVGDFGQARVEQHGNIAVHASFPLTQKIATYLFAPFILWRVLGRIHPKVIIASPAGPEVGLAAIYCRCTGTKLIFRTASDVDCDGRKAQSMGIISMFFFKLGIRLADLIVVQHAKQQSDLKKFYGKESVIIKNGYAFPQRSVVQSERRLVWLGSSRHLKRPDLFFALARELPHYQFHMILSRSGEDRLYHWCEKTAREIPNVTFHGELTPDEAHRHLQGSRVLIGTSDYEGSPNTYSLANMYRIPVISLNVACQGVCAQGSLKLMTAEITRLMEDDTYHKIITDRAYQYAYANNNITTVIKDWLAVIQQVRCCPTN